jgi:SHS2 domain-containing protein
MKFKELKYKVCDDFATADYIFDAYGDTLNELFAACAAACFHAITDLEKVQPLKVLKFEIKADNIEDLLFSFISELIYLKDTEKLFLSEFDIDISPDRKILKAVVAGEPIDYDKHTIKTDVKAATYHNLKIDKTDSGYKVRMLLDL